MCKFLYGDAVLVYWRTNHPFDIAIRIDGPNQGFLINSSFKAPKADCSSWVPFPVILTSHKPSTLEFTN
jgi:hypothetical protein